MEAHAVSDETQYAAMLDAMAQGDIPADVLFKANLTRAQEQALLNGGALIDLAPLIEANMPNLSALLAAHPDWKAAICLEDGRIASLPLLNTTERQVCVWINAKWLSALNLSAPTSVEELTDVLLAFKTGDPNGNYKQDEIAADLIGVYEMRWLLPYFGIVADDSNLARQADRFARLRAGTARLPRFHLHPARLGGERDLNQRRFHRDAQHSGALFVLR